MLHDNPFGLLGIVKGIVGRNPVEAALDAARRSPLVATLTSLLMPSSAPESAPPPPPRHSRAPSAAPPPPAKGAAPIPREVSESRGRASAILAPGAVGIAKELTGMGMPGSWALGFTASMMQESSLNPNAIGDKGRSRGIAQVQGPRLEAMQKMAKEMGVPLNEFGLPPLSFQLSFLVNELLTTERATLRKLMRTRDWREQVRIITESFFRPSRPELEKRIAYAEALLRLAPELLEVNDIEEVPLRLRPKAFAARGRAIRMGLVE